MQILLMAQLRHFQERLNAIIKTVPGVTGIADDVLAKVNVEMSQDTTVCSLLRTARSDNLNFNLNLKQKNAGSLDRY